MNGFWIGCLCTAAVGAAAAVLGALAIVETGAYDTAATAPHLPPTVWALHTTMLRSTWIRSRDIVPPPITGAQVLAGLAQYERDCVICHGAPAVDRAPWARGMTPTPPYLLDAARQMDRAQLYWTIANGVKMTAMPAWSPTRSPEQIWSLVAFIEALPYLPPRTYLQLRAKAQAQIAAAGAPP